MICDSYIHIPRMVLYMKGLEFVIKGRITVEGDVASTPTSHEISISRKRSNHR